MDQTPAEANARRVAAYAEGLGVDRETVLRICADVAVEAAMQPEPPDDAERLAEVRRRLMAAAG